MKPLFSVIMPNYNKAEFIGQAIDSVLAQTYTNWELVIVDDCSTDGSREIIQKYTEKYPKIFAVYLKKNQGISNAMNNGSAHSKGDLIGALDSDDVLMNCALDYMVERHRDLSLSLIVSTISLHDIHMNFLQKEDSLPLLKKDERLFDKRGETVSNYITTKKIKFISMSFRTYKRSSYIKIKGYDKSLSTAEDVDIMYQLEKVGKVLFTDDPIYMRRVFPQSITNRLNMLYLICDFFRAECKEIKRLYKRIIPLCSFKYFPTIMVLYFDQWYRQYRPGSWILLSDIFTQMGFKSRKQHPWKARYYLFVAKSLQRRGKRSKK